jgi:2,3-bisphosphoglycerate-independent phosphoglycerate mutase
VPAMCAAQIAEAVVAALRRPAVDLIVANFVNVDVVGHIEDREAVLSAVEEVDRRIGEVVAAAHAHGVTPVVTADHGTVEKWLYPDGTVDTGHTDSPVPLIVADSGLRGVQLAQGAPSGPSPALTDVAGSAQA